MSEGIHIKGLKDFLNEDADLTIKIGYEDFVKKAAPDNTDDPIAEVYREYQDILRSQCCKSRF